MTSSLNRHSIAQHGLGWRRMGAAPGIAGSCAPEQAGCFLAQDEHTRDWFVGMNNTGGPVDVWEVVDVRWDDLHESAEGHVFYPDTIGVERLRLLQRNKVNIALTAAGFVPGVGAVAWGARAGHAVYAARSARFVSSNRVSSGVMNFAKKKKVTAKNSDRAGHRGGNNNDKHTKAQEYGGGKRITNPQAPRRRTTGLA